MRFVAVVLIVASVGLACAGQMKDSRPAQSSPAAPAKALPNGVWGGEGIRMDVNDGGADIEFGCARGTISQRLVLDAQGGFKLQGTYKAETPAPAADGGSSGSGVPATYAGVLNGSSLRLEVSIEGQDTPRVFDLVQGDQGHLAKCA
ncbi:MAG: hypothetical protein WAN69_17080 [Candidatus Korobacteraceae bacterium]|jgi:hypothetical protein